MFKTDISTFIGIFCDDRLQLNAAVNKLSTKEAKEALMGMEK